MSSWSMQLLMDSCHTSRTSMHRKNLRASAKSWVTWQERLDPMSLRSLFRRRFIMWSILLMTILKRSKKRSHRLNGSKTTRSRWRVHLGRKSLSHTGLTSPKPTRFLTCCCRKGWSSWNHTIRFHRRKSSRTWSTASGITPRRMTQTSAKSSGSKFSWPSSKES